jgi:uncharacterized membrane protein
LQEMQVSANVRVIMPRFMLCSCRRAPPAHSRRLRSAGRLIGTALPSIRSFRQRKVQLGSRSMADERDTEDRVTIVDTNGGGGGGGVLAVVLLVIVVLVLLFLFRDQLGFGGDKTDVNIPDKINVNVN